MKYAAAVILIVVIVMLAMAVSGCGFMEAVDCDANPRGLGCRQ